jgi:hypothetical protein
MMDLRATSESISTMRSSSLAEESDEGKIMQFYPCLTLTLTHYLILLTCRHPRIQFPVVIVLVSDDLGFRKHTDLFMDCERLGLDAAMARLLLDRWQLSSHMVYRSYLPCHTNAKLGRRMVFDR